MLTVRSNELMQLPEPERERKLRALATAARAPRNGQAVVLDQKIRELETSHQMSSDEMLAKVSRGEMTDSEHLSRWLILLRARGI